MSSDAAKPGGRGATLAGLLAVSIALFLALSAASASAAPYVFQAAQTEALSAGVPGGTFSDPFGLTFDAAGNLYVADTHGDAGESIVDKFDDENIFTAQLGHEALSSVYNRSVAVNDETGHIYVGDGDFSELFALDAAGNLLSQWTGANTPEPHSFGAGCCFLHVAVDNSGSSAAGDVYVQTSGSGQVAAGGDQVYVFKPQNGDLEEGEFLRKLTSPEGFEFEGLEGLAVDQATGEIYVADQGHKVVDRFSPSGVYLGQITGPSPTEPFDEPVAVATDGIDGDIYVIDQRSKYIGPHEQETVFEFSSTGALLNRITETEVNQPLIGPTGVSVQESGPDAGAVYVADPGKPAVDVFAEEPPAAPLIEAEGVRQLGESTATFVGEIDPQGAPTEYRFEYGPCSSSTSCALSPYSASVPIPDASLGFEDFTSYPVAPQRVGGLLGATTYHFRLVAHNAEGEIPGEERMFTTAGASGVFVLPDGRRWELVSPTDKGAAKLNGAGETGVVEAAANGSAVSYLANAPTESSPAGGAGSVQVLSTRGPDGWGSRDLATPHLTAPGERSGIGPEYRFFSRELTSAVVQPFGRFTPAISPVASEQTPYLAALNGCSGECFTPLVTGKAGFANVPQGTVFGEEQLCEENNGIGGKPTTICGPEFEGATPDAAHVVLRSAAPLEPGLPRGELYEWTSGQLTLLSVLPKNEGGHELPAPTGPGPGEQPLLGSQFGIATGTARRAISSNGSRVFWELDGALYMRDTAKGESLQIDARESGCSEPQCQSGGGRFQIASVDGSRVFFTDTRRLTADSGGAQGQPDLYECRIVEVEGTLSCDLTDLTPLAGGESADIQGDVLGASEDGTSIYFVADSTLGGIAGAKPGTCENNGESAPQAVGASCNLYLQRADQPTRLVATLSGGDAKLWTQKGEFQQSRVSPNGRWLAFLSSTDLTGYDNRDAVSNQPDAEVYLYSADSTVLTCASCDPSGARPIGVEYRKLESGQSEVLPAVREEWERSGWVAALLPHTAAFTLNKPNYQPRYLDDSGRLFFNGLDALVPQDTNATGDVYQYEQPGVGGCTTASSTFHQGSGGCVDLISSGTSPETSAFLDASESGNDVFFFTGARLTPNDVDSAQDVYDAHVCTAEVPCLPEPTPPATPCSGEACQATAAPPAEVAPSSQTFTGPGNAVTCRKNQVKKAGKCIKKHQKKKHKKKKGKSSGKRKGAKKHTQGK